MVKKKAGMSQPDLYSKLYRIAQSIIKAENPCQIRVEDGIVSCIDTRAYADKYGKDAENKKALLLHQQTLCCTGCADLGPEGCRVEALSCKVWICWELRKQRPDVDSALMAVTGAARNAELPLLIRTSKEDTFRRLR